MTAISLGLMALGLALGVCNVHCDFKGGRSPKRVT